MIRLEYSRYVGGSRRLLPRSFYERDDVTKIARELLGKVVVTGKGRALTSGVIVEAEAYAGSGDRACHAADGKRTARNEVMYGPGGHAYVYLCYGIHHLFNVVTNREGRADAVLIRAVEPLEGMELILKRRGLTTIHRRLTAGPGCLTPALSVTTRDNQKSLMEPGSRLRIEDAGIRIPASRIASGSRIGVGYAGADAGKPWRYWLGGSPWVSR
jgi:DNA-3-methyladenine glycosylase